MENAFEKAKKIVENESELAEAIYYIMSNKYHQEDVLNYFEDHDIETPDEGTIKKIVKRYEKYRDNDDQWNYDLKAAVDEVLSSQNI